MLMNYHIGRLVLSSLCVGAFGAAGFGCGNSSTQSQAPDDGYINVRNMLSAYEMK